MQWCCTFCCDIVAFFAVMVLQSHSPSPLMYFSIYRPFSFVFYEAFIIYNDYSYTWHNNCFR